MNVAELTMPSPMLIAGYLFIPAIGISIIARGSRLSRLMWSVIGLLILLWVGGWVFRSS